MTFLTRISNQGDKYIGAFDGVPGVGATLAVIAPGDSAEILVQDDVNVNVWMLDEPEAKAEMRKMAEHKGDHHAA